MTMRGYYYPGISPALPKVAGCDKIKTTYIGVPWGGNRDAMLGDGPRTGPYAQEIICKFWTPVSTIKTVLINDLFLFGPLFVDQVAATDYYVSLNYNLIRAKLGVGDTWPIAGFTYANSNYSEQLAGGSGVVSDLYQDSDNYKLGGTLLQQKCRTSEVLALNGMSCGAHYSLMVPANAHTRTYHVAEIDTADIDDGPYTGIHLYVAFGVDGDQYTLPGSYYSGAAGIDSVYVFDGAYATLAQVEHD